jgi:hypothetical protein
VCVVRVLAEGNDDEEIGGNEGSEEKREGKARRQDVVLIYMSIAPIAIVQ